MQHGKRLVAKEAYAKQGIDTDAVLDKLAGKAISVNCWQGVTSSALTRATTTPHPAAS